MHTEVILAAPLITIRFATSLISYIFISCACDGFIKNARQQCSNFVCCFIYLFSGKKSLHTHTMVTLTFGTVWQMKISDKIRNAWLKWMWWGRAWEKKVRLRRYHYFIIMNSVGTSFVGREELNFALVGKTCERKKSHYISANARRQNECIFFYFCSLPFRFPSGWCRLPSVRASGAEKSIFCSFVSQFVVNQTMNTYELHMAACPAALSHANSKVWL